MVNPYQGYINPYNQQFQMPQQPRNNRIWVQGETGAKSYLVAPNSIVDLWDSESKTIYVKSADATGMPVMEILDYTIRGSNTEKELQKAENPKYASADEVEALKSEIQAIKEQLKHTPQQKKKVVTEDE